jgi:hypothetical protein
VVAIVHNHKIPLWIGVFYMKAVPFVVTHAALACTSVLFALRLML